MEMGKIVRRKSFVFNTDWQEILLGCPSEVRLEVYDAIIEYAASGTLLELKPMAKMAFSFIRKEIDSNELQYQENFNKKSLAGKKGMEARYQKEEFVTEPNKAYQTITEANTTYHNLTEPNRTYQDLTDANRRYQTLTDANKCYQMLTNANKTPENSIELDLFSSENDQNSGYSSCFRAETDLEQTWNEPRTNLEQTNIQKNEKENEKEKYTKEKEKEKEKKEEKTSKKKFLDLSFVSSEYMEAFQEWLDYKKARKETYQTQMGVKKCYSHLLNLCNNNPDTAKQIVNQSIANNWAGLFELKTLGKVSVHPTGESGSNGLKLGKGERFENGRRTYGTGIANIPLNAPPRPSEQYFWNADNQQWAIA